MKLIELHILQSFPVSCLNRDDLGSPKSATFGGAPRARLSSQCLKRAVRELAQELSPALFAGNRSRLIIEPLGTRLQKHGVAETKATEIAKQVGDHLATLDDAAEKKGTLKVKTLMFLSPSEVDAIAKALADIVKKDPKAKGLDKAVAKACKSAALKDAADLVALGPRPSGTEAARRAQNLIIGRLKAAGLVVRQDAFTAATPEGDISMKNIIGVLQGKRPGVIVIGAHYDTKRFKDQRFVGANDGGAGTGAVLELARAMAIKGKPRYTYWFVLFDGEESIGEWTDEDSLYGSRHLVDMLRRQKLLGNVRAMILLDMIGDADLTILKESNSYGSYRDLFWVSAQRLGYGDHFMGDFATVADDHLPFVRAGIRSVNLIDFMYGDRKLPGKYWHAPEDTMDKISAKSLQITGDVVLATLPEIENFTYVIETRAGVAPPLDPEEERATAIPPPLEGDVTGGVLESPAAAKPTRPTPVAPQRAP